MTTEEMASGINRQLDEMKKGMVTQEAFDAFKASINPEAMTKEISEKLDGLEQTLVKQAEELAKIRQESAKEQTLAEFLKANKEVITRMASGEKRLELEIKATTLRSSITGSTQGYELPDIGQLATKKMSLYDILPKIPVTGSNHNGVIKYWDWDAATTVRNANTVAEGAAIPESTAKWTEYTLPIQKIGDSLPFSEEFMNDEAMFAAELDLFMRTNVELKREDQLVNGNGTAPNLKGIVSSVPAFTPAASGIQDASIYDLIIKLHETISEPYGGKYSPDFVLMNIKDINKMRFKKDTQNNYVMPPFVSQSGALVGPINVIENNYITQNTLVIGDRRFAKIYEIPGVTLSEGYVNDDFTKDLMRLKATLRAALLVRTVDQTGFLKVTSISAALTTLAT